MSSSWGMVVSGSVVLPGIEANLSKDMGVSAEFVCNSTITGLISLVCSASIAVELARLATMEGYILTIRGGYIYLGKK